jgi:hypothetical protein
MTLPSLRHERHPSLRMDKVELRGCLESCIMGVEPLRRMVSLRDGEEIRPCQLSAWPIRQT